MSTHIYILYFLAPQLCFHGEMKKCTGYPINQELYFMLKDFYLSWDFNCKYKMMISQQWVIRNTIINFILNLKVPITITADNILKYFSYFSGNIRCGKSYFSLFKENKTWHFMWIICLADDSHRQMIHMKYQVLFSLKNNKKKIRLSSVTILLSTLKVTA